MADLLAPLERKVLLTVKTSGGYEAGKSLEGIGHILNGAFRENVRQLLNSAEFRTLATAPPSNRSTTAPVAYGPLHLPAAASARMPIPDTVKAVVSIFANAGMGSGFVVSQGGYVLTNQHVVGDARFVKLKWSDGSEALGEVIRADRRRDVALVKAETKGQPALAVRNGVVALGDTVFAIGTPLDEKYQNTLPKGVVSGVRTIDGLPFLQSDVAIDHGNSGGPLLEEQGRVVAITVLRDERDGVGHDISFFVPISEALTALGIAMDTPVTTSALASQK